MIEKLFYEFSLTEFLNKRTSQNRLPAYSPSSVLIGSEDATHIPAEAMGLEGVRKVNESPEGARFNSPA
jgi:hypothetical protein